MSEGRSRVTKDQKELKKKEILHVFESLRSRMPLADLTLTVVAKEMGCNRANLVNYYPTITSLCAAAWSHKMIRFAEEFTAELESLSDISCRSYSELAYEHYFVRSDILRYISFEATLAESDDARDIIMDNIEHHNRLRHNHLEILSRKFSITPLQADYFNDAVHYIALGLYNSEATVTNFPSDLSERADDFIRRRYIRLVTGILENILRNDAVFNSYH